ncbi:MAG: T9SS type A sorting domain-containing protein [Flavobacteriia bacterium]
MKRFFFICLLITTSTFAQEWQSIASSDFSCNCGFTYDPSYASKTLKINPYTNDLWMGKPGRVNLLTNGGEFIEYNAQNMNITPQTYTFLDFAFTSDAVYALRYFEGFYEFKNNIWTHHLDNYQSSSITQDKDTIFVTGISENYHEFYSNNLIEFQNSTVRKTANKSGLFWGTGGTSAVFEFTDTQNYFHNADTCTLLSNYAYDIKFSKKTDSLYVAGDLGLSIAYGNDFIDSIDVISSINMPANPSIMEFEFDHLDNIWALFGTALHEMNGIGYYNQQNRTWEQFYDGNNSPIDFTQKLTIEVDTSGNLWVAERDFLHVLKINNPPSWLATKQLEKDKTLKIYPNPSANHFKIDVSKIKGNYEVSILDVFGKTVATFANQNEIQHNLAQGVYFIELRSEDGLIVSQKLVVQ